ncbi:MAG: hypothetical protein C5B56_08450 [Proteobacteria bacterium]|nr:MAG: hypothetical protein C5B56_08450 [Pseudomonadota bacterium]
MALAALFFGLWAVPVSIGNDAGAGEFRRFAIAIKNRKVDVAQKLIRVTRGDTLELEFSTDETAELHLHGYDKLIKVDPATPAVLHLDASIAGRFSIEAHGFGSARSGYHVLLLYLEVHP